MNDRIRQLALDAGIGFTLWDDSGREMIDNYTSEEYLEKFAELIVKECADLAYSYNIYGRGRAWNLIIKEHFGFPIIDTDLPLYLRDAK